jgi:hypothetical protein
MNLLPNADMAVIPMEKLINYSLDFGRDPNKAMAFRLALGYTKNNADKLRRNIHKSLQKYGAAYKGNNGYGDIYEVIMRLTGENGKTANVLTAWIIENGVEFPRLVNTYITRKKIVG